MRNIFVISLIFLCTILFAQEESKTSIKGGAKALIFEFDGLDNLSADSYEGGIGGKIFFNNTLALRVIVIMDRLYQEQPANPGTGLDGANEEYTSSTYGLGAGLEFHWKNKTRVSPYAGLGLGFARFSEEYKPMEIWFPGTNEYRRIETQTGYIFDFMGMIGAELFILKEVSLSAEYLFNVQVYNAGDTEYKFVALSGDPVMPNDYTDKGYVEVNYGFRSYGRLLLSIYF